MTTLSSIFERHGPRLLEDGSLARHVVVTPGMCGPTSLFAGRLGDWTWDAVSASCGVDAYRAHDASGTPTYLSFSYFRIRGSAELHPLRLTFGDRLGVVSRVFGTGSESVLTLHQVRHDNGAAPAPIDPAAFYTVEDAGTLRVENFNRWVVRTRAGVNRDLATASPGGFRHHHLPTMPAPYSVRRVIALARTKGSFLEREPPDRTAVVTDFRATYLVDASRDLNGVGLLYFASYFAIVDWALLRLWRHLGRGLDLFRRRVVLDQQLAFLANADGDAVVEVAAIVRRHRHDPDDELVEMTLCDRAGGRALAVCSLHVRSAGQQR